MPDSFTIADLEASQVAPVPEIVPPVETPTPETPVIPEATPTQDVAETPSVPAVEVEDVVADPAAPAPADPAVVNADPAAASDSADLEVEAPTKGSRARERIEGLVDENKALREYADLWKNKALEALQSPTPPVPLQPAPTQPVSANVEAAPTLEDNEMDTAKWAKAMTAYTHRQIQAGIQAAMVGAQQQQTEEAIRASFVAREEAYAKANPDYKIVISNPNLPRLDKDVARMLVTVDDGLPVMHYLGKHPDVATRIAKQSPTQQAASIGRIQAELAAPKPAPPKVTPKPNNVTRAPAPPNPIPAVGSIALDPLSMGMDEFFRQHKMEKIEKRKMLAPNQRPRR